MTSLDTSEPVIHVAPSPHIVGGALTTRRMMTDVLIALIPVAGMAVYLFRAYALRQMFICIASCLLFEAGFARLRNRPLPLRDCSAAVTGLILALSLPGTAPWYVGVIASLAAMGIGKAIFGGIGMNLFNPAMVGRAFVMISFAGALGAPGYQLPGGTVDILSQATPMDVWKQTGSVPDVTALFWGLTNGSLGETSAAASLLGGIYLCLRRTASWEIPAGILASATIIALLADLTGTGWSVLHHLFGGALLFGAFFIATDPVSSPVTPLGKLIFGFGTGTLIMVLRLFSSYPEGVMFAVLLMNAVTPLINRWTIPAPLGGR